MRSFFNILANLYVLTLLVRWLVEVFVPNQTASSWFSKLKMVTDPILNLIRKLVPPYKGVDFSYLIAIFGVLILMRILMTLV